MSSSCPLCRQVGFKSIRDKKIERAVQDMEVCLNMWYVLQEYIPYNYGSLIQVFCHHESSGCAWLGKLCDVESHLASNCPYVLIECTNSCSDIMPRKELQSHLTDSCCRRHIKCPHCEVDGPFDFITDEHHKMCPKVPLNCPNRCSAGKLLREDMTVHLNECPLQIIECGFRSFGCEEAVFRKDLDAHMSSQQTHHLLLAMEKVSDMSRLLNSWRDDTEKLKDELEKSHREVENLRTLVQTLQPQQSTAGVLSVSLSEHRPTRRLLMEKHLEASIQNCQRDPFLPVILKMDDYHFYSTNREPWYSHPFYSAPLGYKFCLCVYAGGICSGQFTHVSAYVHLMAGEFDENQEWPLELRVTIELQNQLADKDHWGVDCDFRRSGPHQISHRVNRGRARRGAGTATFIRLEKLGHNAAFSNCHYLRNNQLFFSVY